MNKIFAIIEQAYHFRKTLKRCEALSPESAEYKLGKFYKDEIEQFDDAQLTQENIDQMLQRVKQDQLQHKDSELMAEMLSSVESFLTTLKRFASG